MLESFSQLPERRGLLSWNCSTPSRGELGSLEILLNSPAAAPGAQGQRWLRGWLPAGRGEVEGTGRWGRRRVRVQSPDRRREAGPGRGRGLPGRRGPPRAGLAGAFAPRHLGAGRFSGWRKPGGELSSCRLCATRPGRLSRTAPPPLCQDLAGPQDRGLLLLFGGACSVPRAW